MGMAQQAPQQEDDMLSPLSDQDLMDSGLPTGQDENAIKERIMSLLGRFGILEQVSDENKIKLEKEAAKLAKAIVNKDIETIEASPLNDIFEKIVEEQNASLEPSEEDMAMMEQETAMPQQGQAKPAATKDFTSMMPPAGGGILGR